MKISIIAAIGAKTRALGKNDKLLWQISDDLKRFKEITMRHPIIMGRKTYESIGRPLPGRLNIIVTRNKKYRQDGIIVVGSIEKAIEVATEADSEEIFFIGGADIYKQALPITNRLYLTLIESDDAGDVFFPEYSEFKKEIFRETRKMGDLQYTWISRDE
jgi:dihydrofolate reductase